MRLFLIFVASVAWASASAPAHAQYGCRNPYGCQQYRDRRDWQDERDLRATLAILDALTGGGRSYYVPTHPVVPRYYYPAPPMVVIVPQSTQRGQGQCFRTNGTWYRPRYDGVCDDG